jgi:hypothetical protein
VLHRVRPAPRRQRRTNARCRRFDPAHCCRRTGEKRAVYSLPAQSPAHLGNEGRHRDNRDRQQAGHAPEVQTSPTCAVQWRRSAQDPRRGDLNARTASDQLRQPLHVDRTPGFGQRVRGGKAARREPSSGELLPRINAFVIRVHREAGRKRCRPRRGQRQFCRRGQWRHFDGSRGDGAPPVERAGFVVHGGTSPSVDLVQPSYAPYHCASVRQALTDDASTRHIPVGGQETESRHQTTGRRGDSVLLGLLPEEEANDLRGGIGAGRVGV